MPNELLFYNMLNSIEQYYLELSEKDLLPQNHIKYLEKLKRDGFEPNVIYDIGSCVLHWTRHAKRIWPNAQIILFDANPYCKFLYDGYQFYSGILSNISGINKKFYLNEFSPGGASYYREIGSPYSNQLYPENRYYMIKSMTLDDVATKYNLPPPDLVKMDVQGSEKDILEGGKNIMNNTKHLIMEIPKPGIMYNQNSPSREETFKLADILGWECTAPLFSDNGNFDGDYGFTRKKFVDKINNIYDNQTYY
ncbi:methyltransferase FkbM family protein [Tupanvirus soda lake]|uniref:Methyltransferase FkbM family protein n=2 Tax=Tupanvirus TaxID=2094720 RepID=A0A6N1NIX7_9VIRU|nr:methyltransferase FkbM family protein [Tupanvirus soda lake]QKU34835.1 methyltransferase FkbM family protein [Tupanvirus soda lake]